MTVLGIDQGTTGTCALLIEPDGRVVAQAYRAHTQHHPQPDQVEHDPHEIWRHIQEVIHEVLSASTSPLTAVGLANQGETCMAWRRDTGEPLGRAIVWQDQRTHAWIQELARDTALQQRVLHTTGLQLDAYPSASKMRWLLDNTPGARELAATGRLCIGTLDAWLLRKLSGQDLDITDASTAARTLLLDLHTRTWAPWLLELFGLTPNLLPTLCESTATPRDPLLHLAAIPGLEHVPLLASVVDQPAALYGHGCLTPGMSKATYGTGCFVYMNTGPTPRPATEGLLSTLVWLRQGEPAYALDGGVFSMGSALNWTRDGLGLIEDPHQLDDLLAQTSHSHGVVCVPALSGLACPYWKRDTRAAFFGMSLSTQREHLLFALLESLALRVVQVIRAMERNAGANLPVLRVDGGLTQCRTLMQLQADLLGVPVEVAATTETTALGIASMAAQASGLMSDEDIAQRAGVAERFTPRISRDAAAERLKAFEHAVSLAMQW